MEVYKNHNDNEETTNILQVLVKFISGTAFLIAFLSYVALMVMGCGTQYPDPAAENKTTEEKQAIDNPEWADYSNQNLKRDSFSVSGYVTPINITVDGKLYKDSEDFYTQELRRLQADVKEKYEGYKLTFDASIGLRNFKNGMAVFLAATSDIGVASESIVNASGKFSFLLEGDTDRNVMYTMRATKRISLKLVKGKDIIQWCYNLYAEKEVVLDGKSVILRQFGTTLTEYQCSDFANSIQLPDRQYTVEEEENMQRDQQERERTAAMNDEVVIGRGRVVNALGEPIDEVKASSSNENTPSTDM